MRAAYEYHEILTRSANVSAADRSGETAFDRTIRILPAVNNGCAPDGKRNKPAAAAHNERALINCPTK